MKVLKVNPGSVDSRFRFSVIVTTTQGRVVQWNKASFESASAAKQAMREHVAYLRRKHCV